MRDRLRGPALLVAAALAGAACARTPPPANVVVILIDDLGWMDAAAFGNDALATPAIDRLAAEGARFTSAYANAPNCAPARASILAGQYPPRHGIHTVATRVAPPAELRKLDPPETARDLPLAVVTIAEALAPRGYRSASIGKWHLGFGPAFAPGRQGFEVDVGSGGGVGQTASHVSPYRLRDLPEGPPGEYLGDRLTDEAIRFVEADDARPFFLYLSHYAVHEPHQADAATEARHLGDAARERGQAYAAMVAATDRGIGRLLDALDRAGRAGDTAVFLLGDNGGNRLWSAMGDLRGTKGTLYEGGLRVPLVVRWPGVAVPGRVHDDPVMGADLYPTILDAAGVAAPPGHVLDGVSLVPVLRGAGLPERPLFWHFPHYLWSRRGEFRLTPASAVRRGPYKLIELLEDGRIELYDLARDPGERDDLSAREPATARALGAELHAWRDAVGAPMPVPRRTP